MVVSASKAKTVNSIYKTLSRKLSLSYPYSWLLYHRLSPTLIRFKDLANQNPDKFKAYMKLLDLMHNIAKNDGVKMKLTLHLPSTRALLNIGIERLVADKDALDDIIKKCYQPSKGKIDLRPLVNINVWHTPAPLQT